MKRTLLAVAIATLCVVSAHAQSAVGSLSVKPMVGGTLTSVVGKDVTGAKMKIGLVAGAEMTYQVSPKFAVSGGGLYTMQGYGVDQQYDPKMKLDYLNIPIMASYYVAPGLAIKAGVQPGILLSAKETASDNGVSADIDVKDLHNTVDVSIPIGISYEIKQFVIDARYCFGVTKIEKTSGTYMGQTIQNPNNSVRNSVFMLTLGYNIPIK